LPGFSVTGRLRSRERLSLQSTQTGSAMPEVFRKTPGKLCATWLRNRLAQRVATGARSTVPIPLAPLSIREYDGANAGNLPC
jgi:hypothetical protein